MLQVSARDVGNALEAIAPKDSGVEGDQLGFLFGDPDKKVRGVACVWIAHTPGIQAAADKGCDMLIIHETPFMRPQTSNWYEPPAESEIVGNRSRHELLERHGMVVYRSHSNWDALAVDGVPDQAVASLGIAGLKVHAARKFFKVHELPEAMTVAQLAERAKSGTGVPWVRVFGDPAKKIRRFAFLVGGFGENQMHMPQQAGALGAEAIIIGEMGEFVVIAAMECGLPVIETLHSASEEPALRRQAEMLQAKFPSLPFHFIPTGALCF